MDRTYLPVLLLLGFVVANAVLILVSPTSPSARGRPR